MKKRKNKIIIILISLLALFQIVNLLAANDSKSTLFEFNDYKGDVYNLSSYVKQKLLLDEKLFGNYEYKYVGVLEVIDKIGTSSKLNGNYYVYNKPAGSSESYLLVNEESTETEFIRKKNGEMIIDKSYLYPTVRDIPIFPDKSVSVGEEWEADAVEVMDFTSMGAFEPYRIPLQVLYKYQGDEIYQEKEVAVFSIKYFFDYDMYEKPNPNSDKLRPIYLTGLFEGKYYWDKERSAPLFYEAESIFTYLLKNGKVLEVRTSEYGEVKKESDYINEAPISEVPDERKTEIAEDIKDELKEKELDEDFNVKEKTNGVAINLGDILFDFNSYELKPESVAKLDEIAKILKRYENFNISIEGYTDNIGTDSFNQELSENRATTVKEYLITKGVSPENLNSMGFGEENPVASNNTDEGRKLNRRVEIIIITDN